MDCVQSVYYLLRSFSENPRRRLNGKPVQGSTRDLCKDVALFVAASLLTNSAWWALPHTSAFPLGVFLAAFILDGGQFGNVVALYLLSKLRRENYKLTMYAAAVAHMVRYAVLPTPLTLAAAGEAVLAAEIKQRILLESPTAIDTAVACALLPLAPFEKAIWSYPAAVYTLCSRKVAPDASLVPVAFAMLVLRQHLT